MKGNNMKKNEGLNKKLLNNLNYILINLEKAINEANFLEDKLYLEISKNQIINYLNNVYLDIKHWKENYEVKNYEAIIKKYNEIESIISQLELCLADYENKFNMNGISYSIYQIGVILTDIRIDGD